MSCVAIAIIYRYFRLEIRWQDPIIFLARIPQFAQEKLPPAVGLAWRTKRRPYPYRTKGSHVERALLRPPLVAVPLLLLRGSGIRSRRSLSFVMVSHIGSNDPNMNWLTTSIKTFEEKYPDAKAEYLSTNEYSLQNFITILNQAIATHPDGIAIPILNSEALQPILDKAVKDGIPVVAFNISDPRPQEQRIHYLRGWR